MCTKSYSTRFLCISLYFFVRLNRVLNFFLYEDVLSVVKTDTRCIGIQRTFSLERVPVQLGFRRFLGTWRILARKNVRDYQKYFVILGEGASMSDAPSPFSEAGSVTHEICPSDKIYTRVTSMRRRRS